MLKSPALSAVCLLFVGAPAAFGLGFRLSDMDAFATGRGDAFTATADNPSAVFYNPAGLTQLEGLDLRLGVYAIDLEDEFSPDADGANDVDTVNGIQGTANMFVSFAPKKEPIALGLGFYSPYGLGLEWPEDGPFRTLAKRGYIAYGTVNPVVALQVSRTFSVAAGFTVNYANAELDRGIEMPGDNFEFKGEGVAYGFTAGAMWQPTPQHSFGVKYHSATDVRFSGHSSARLTDSQRAEIRAGNEQIRQLRETLGPAADAILASQGLPLEGFPESFPEDDADAKIHFPQFIVAGYSFRPTPAWNFEFNVDWTDWDSLNTVTLHQTSGDIAIPFNYVSSFIWEFGATHYLNNGLHLSAGYMYSENSVPDSQFSPAVPDSDRHLFTAGVGQKFARWNWDLAYQFGYGPTRSIDNEGPADGDYRFRSHAISVSLGYNF